MAGYNLGTASGRIVVDGSGAKAGFQVAEAAAQSFYSVLQNKLSSIESFGENLMKASAVGAAGFTVAGNAAANFEERLSAVRAVSGATESQMQAISEAALEIGANTSFSATEAASAFEELVKAGISVDDALNGAAQATADLAAAGEVALPRAAEIAATAMNNFNLSGDDMPRVADLIAGAANASAISVEEFAMSLQQVGAVANLTGLSFDETAVAIAEMGNAGIKGSDAGTSLKTMMMNLIPTTKAQVSEFERLGLMAFDSGKAMEALGKNNIPAVGNSLEDVRSSVSAYLEATQGIPADTAEMGDAIDKWLTQNGAMNNAFFDTEGNMESLSSVQQTLQDATKNMTKEQKLASLEIMFGSDAIRGAAVMAEAGSAGFEELAASMGKVTAQDVSATRLDNLKGDLEELSGAWETMLIKIGQVVTPIARYVVQALTGVINVFNNLDERAQKFFASLGLGGTVLAGIAGAIIKLAFVAAPLLLVLGKFLLMKQLAGIFGAFWGVLRAGGGIMAATTAAFVRLKAALSLMIGLGGKLKAFAVIMKGVWAALMGPVGIVIAAIAALVAVGVTLYNTWEPFRELVDKIGAALRDGFEAAVQGAKDAWEGFVAGFTGSDSKMSGVAGAMQSLGSGVKELWEQIKLVGSNLMAQIGPAWQDFMNIMRDQVKPALQELGDVIMTELWPALQDLGKVIVEEVWPALQQIWEAIAPVIGFLVKLAFIIVGVVLLGLIKLAAYILGEVIPAFISFAGPIIGGLLTAIAKVATWVVKYLITPFVDFITFLISDVIPAIGEFVGGLITGFQDAWNAVKTWVSDVWGAITGFFDDLGGAGDSAGEAASTGVQSFFGAISQFFVDIWNNITGFVQDVAQTLTDFMMPGIEAVMAAWEEISPILDWFFGLFERVFSAIYGVVEAYVKLVFQIARFYFASLLEAIKIIGQAIWDFLVFVWTGIRDSITAALTAVWEFVVSIWNTIWAFLQPILTAIWTFITDTWNNIYNSIASALNSAWSFIVSIWTTVYNYLSGVLTSIWSAVSGAFMGVYNSIASALGSAWSYISSIWSTIYGYLSGVVSSIWSTVSGAFNRVYSSIRDSVVNAYNSVVDQFSRVVGYLSGVKDQIVGVFSGAASWLINAGVQIMEGLVQGIESALGAVKAKLNSVTDMIPDWKGPADRDKVLLEPAGELIMKSLVNGFENEVSKVYQMLNGLTDDISMQLSAAVTPTFSMFDARMMLGGAPVSSSSVTPATAAAPILQPLFDVAVRIGDRDITDLVDVRITEHLDDAAELIGTGVNN